MVRRTEEGDLVGGRAFERYGLDDPLRHVAVESRCDFHGAIGWTDDLLQTKCTEDTTDDKEVGTDCSHSWRHGSQETSEITGLSTFVKPIVSPLWLCMYEAIAHFRSSPTGSHSPHACRRLLCNGCPTATQPHPCQQKPKQDRSRKGRTQRKVLSRSVVSKDLNI